MSTHFHMCAPGLATCRRSRWRAGPLPAHVMHLQNLGGHGDHVGSVWLVVLRLAVEGGVNVLSLVASFGLGTQNSPFREKREPVLWAVGAVPGNWPGWVAGCPAGRCGCWVPWQLLLPFAPSLDSEGRVSAVQPPGCSGQGQGRVPLSETTASPSGAGHHHRPRHSCL